jgi:hypothetical protein
MARGTRGKCKSFLCLVLMFDVNIFETKYSILLLTKNIKYYIYCGESGDIVLYGSDCGVWHRNLLTVWALIHTMDKVHKANELRYFNEIWY